MKTLFSALLAATLIASPLAATAAEAQQQRTVTTIKERPNGRTVVRQKTTVRQQPRYNQQVRQWQRGERFDRRNARNYRVVSNYRTYRLATPPRGYQWVRSNNDAVLVALSGGQIRSVVRGVIR